MPCFKIERFEPDKNHWLTEDRLRHLLDYLSEALMKFYKPYISFERSLIMLRISIGIIYLWFGGLKFFPGLSPAEDLAKLTIFKLTFGVIQPEVSLVLLAIWETFIGVVLISGVIQRIVIPLVLLHMVLTFSPFLLLPDLSFSSEPFVLTLVGQYIIKNLIIISSILVIGSYRHDQVKSGS
jgi:uncharacterized membrane protein YphA (DoxX/SURF4 family)